MCQKYPMLVNVYILIITLCYGVIRTAFNELNLMLNCGDDVNVEKPVYWIYYWCYSALIILKNTLGWIPILSFQRSMPIRIST